MLKLKGGKKMLNEIMQNGELRKRKLTDLYEEGIIGLGDEIPYKHSEETYLSPKGEKCLKLIAQQPVFKLNLRS